MLVRVLIGCALAVGLAAPLHAADDLKPGDTLDKDTWRRAEGMLPPEILAHYQKGEYVNAIASWPESQYTWPPDFKAATQANEGKFTIGERGVILAKDTNKQPEYILGHPFPTIDPADPNAGTKIVWNYFYRTWYFGNLLAESQVNWISPTGLERRSDQDVRFAYYDGIPEDEKLPNPHNYITQSLVLVKAPTDLNGTAALTWRYRDPERRDSSWTYVPALRRVRAVSPANRSDGFLGSDMSQDDGPFFDGKPEDFEWRLKGEVEWYRIADSLNLKGEARSKWVDGIGWDAEWPDVPFIGYMDPGWKGAAWAPRGSAVLAKRKLWVVEGVPRDKYYLYGKLEMYIDKISFQGAWDRKFDWKGELLATMQVMAWNPIAFTRPTGKVDYNQGSTMSYQCVENLRLNRATVAGIKSSPTSGFYGRIKFDPAVFDVNALSRMGK